MPIHNQDSTNIVITMAGRGSRFVAAGYKVPKYAIIAHGRTLFEWSMLSLKNLTHPDSRLIFVCLKENNAEEFVNAQCARMGYHNVQVIEIDELNDGQATSALLSQSYWNPDAPLLIYNIDTYVKPSALSYADIQVGAHGWIPCFRAEGDHWSFILTDNNGWAVEAAEKRRISDNATIGLYWFASCDEYARCYEQYFEHNQHLVNGERYVAPLYSYMIAQGKKIAIANLDLNDVHVLGTPAELEAFNQAKITSIE